MKPVLFATGLGLPLSRTENLLAIFNAYDGDKKFMRIHDNGYKQELTSGKYDVLVIDVFPELSPGKTIMLWHAIQGGKHIGLDEHDTYYQPSFAQYIDRIVSAGHGSIPMFASCTGVPKDKILPLGMPRTDQYVGKHKGDGHTRLADKRAYLYAPTYRTLNEPPMPDIDWAYLNDNLTNDELLVVKSHQFTQTLRLHNYPRIMEVSGLEPSAKYLYDCDVLVTDYSSIMFDAYLLGKPVVLFEKNPGYIAKRGMYLDYPLGYSSRFAITEEGLLSMLRTADTLTPIETNCISLLADACDGHSCERICKLIHEMNRGDTH